MTKRKNSKKLSKEDIRERHTRFLERAVETLQIERDYLKAELRDAWNKIYDSWLERMAERPEERRCDGFRTPDESERFLAIRLREKLGKIIKKTPDGESI